jgi:hypothetical protein
MKILYAGDSWAIKGYTEQNYSVNVNWHIDGDTRLSDFWPVEYECCFAGGRGNLEILEKIQKLNIDPQTPIVWIYTEPGRDYGTITGNPPFEWMQKENIFEIRQELDAIILKTIQETISNPIGLVGGLSDINVELATELGYTVLHPSWQQWISNTLNSQWFKFGWGASDIGWRYHADNILPSKTALFEWDEQIKEWCWWEDNGYFCHEHPTPKANKEFATYLQPTVMKWLSQYE